MHPGVRAILTIWAIAGGCGLIVLVLIGPRRRSNWLRRMDGHGGLAVGVLRAFVPMGAATLAARAGDPTHPWLAYLFEYGTTILVAGGALASGAWWLRSRHPQAVKAFDSDEGVSREDRRRSNWVIALALCLALTYGGLLVLLRPGAFGL